MRFQCTIERIPRNSWEIHLHIPAQGHILRGSPALRCWLVAPSFAMATLRKAWVEDRKSCAARCAPVFRSAHQPEPLVIALPVCYDGDDRQRDFVRHSHANQFRVRGGTSARQASVGRLELNFVCVASIRFLKQSPHESSRHTARPYKVADKPT